jgi:DNA-binding CsgD family transcriptional regulator
MMYVRRGGTVSNSYELPPALQQATQAIGATRGRALQLQSVFDRSLMPMVLVDNERRYLEANAAARLLARVSLRDIRRLRIDDYTAEADRPMMEAAWAELIQRGAVSGRYHVTFPDQSDIWLLYAAIANALPGRHLVVFVPADWPGEELDAIQPSDEAEDPSALSARQLDVLRLVAVGANAAQIAAELSISEATVRTHVKNILERLGAHNRAHAVALAMTQGLLSEGASSAAENPPPARASPAQ